MTLLHDTLVGVYMEPEGLGFEWTESPLIIRKRIISKL